MLKSVFYKLRGYYNHYLPAETRRRLIFNLAAFPIIILLVLYLIADIIIMPIITRQGSEFELYDIREMQIADAEELLALRGLSLEITSEEYHFDKPEGTILSQYPAPITMVKSGRIIRVVASIGQKDVKVPKLSGISVRQAKLHIESSDLVLGDIAWTFVDSLPERIVVFSYPAEGRDVPIGTPINLMVNRGSLTNVTFMPKLIGLALEEARVKIDDAKLVIGLVKYVTNENYLPETVLEQSVEEATELEHGEEIDLVVSSTE